MCAIARVNAVDIEFNVADVSHPFAGFGAQVWSGDTRIESLITSLNLKYVRLKFGGNWNPPTDATQAEMDAYVALRYDGNVGIRNTYAILTAHNIAVIGIFFEGPSIWLGEDNLLHSENFDDFVRLWVSIAYYMHMNNMPIRYIEMFNEPEGNWNIRVPAASYNKVVKLMRAELDSRGLTEVEIIGPGLAYLYHGSAWISALDADGKAALGAWSTHAWDEGWGHKDALPDFLDQRWQDYFGAAVRSADSAHSKPIIVTEYATGVQAYNGVTYGNDYTETSQFAQRCYENSLTLVNNGANVLCYWEAANQSWQSSPMSGYLRTDSTRRPVYEAMMTLASHVPDNAMVLRKTWNDPVISAAGFIGDNQLVLAFANSTANTVTRTVKVTGITSFLMTSAQAFESGTVIDKSPSLSFDYDSGSLEIVLPPESTLTVKASVNECTARLTGDLTGDCRVAMDDYHMVAADWLKDNQVVGLPASVEDFESYGETSGLISEWVPTANVTVRLDTTILHSGSKAMKYQYNNGASPYYSKVMHWLEGSGIGVDWTGYDTLTVWFKCTSEKEPLQVNVVNCYGATVLSASYGTPNVGDWTRWNINLSPIPAGEITQIGRIDIFFTGLNYGPGTVYFDDIGISNSNSVICSGEPAGDVNQDCVVDVSDILELSENWLRCTIVE
jgi:hypothetical protein